MKVKIQIGHNEPIIYDSAKVAIAVLLDPSDREFIKQSKQAGNMAMCGMPANHPLMRDEVKRSLFAFDGWGEHGPVSRFDATRKFKTE